MCGAHGLHSAPLAAYELSWSANSRWLYAEDLFMSQSNSTLTGEKASIHHTAPVKNIVDTTIDAGNFTTLAAGLKAAGLTDILSKKGPFTVFAPTDEAFKKLPAGAMDALLKDTAKLKGGLTYHVMVGLSRLKKLKGGLSGAVVVWHVSAKDMKTGDVMTMQGSPLTAVVAASDVQVNGAHVRRADLVATNGVIHAIDTVIMPKNWQLLAAAA